MTPTGAAGKKMTPSRLNPNATVALPGRNGRPAASRSGVRLPGSGINSRAPTIITMTPAIATMNAAPRIWPPDSRCVAAPG